MADDAIRDTVENFRDYWTAKAGQAATKIDWPATWRTWVRRELDNQREKAARAARFAKPDRNSRGRFFIP
jgi:hypothetical protein